ncbi:sigma-70 family RNA polymerase sigma factor [bacterium]|nr:sigma-70 family RNA polymerase sigma factor [bacterium]
MNEPIGPDQFSRLFIDWSNGNESALDEMLPLIYEELRRLAAYHLKRERNSHTLQATALVHEAYMRLINQRQVDWRNRAQFLGLASEMMRRILVSHARKRAAAKRGGHEQRVSLSIADLSSKRQDVDVLMLDDALNKLASRDFRKSRVVELKFFGGLKTDEIAELLQISGATVEREWTLARAWLFRTLSGSQPSLP